MATLQLRIPKAGDSFPIDTDKVPVEVYEYALKLGLEQIARRGMTKITGKSDSAKADAKAQAEANIENIYAGKVRMVGAAKVKGAGALNTEKMRLARLYVKQGLKDSGEKLSYYTAADISEAARGLLAADPGIEEEAKENLAKRAEKKAKVDVTTLIKRDPKKVAETEAKLKGRGGAATLSTAQAGLVATRGRPTPQHR